jgi:RIO-like serine/threonine protein kinase
MQLIRDNIEKRRQVYYCGDRYRKVWDNTVSSNWIKEHVHLLKQIVPGHVLDYSDCWIEYAVVPGTLVSELTHTPELVKKVYNFCLDNILETYPYVHGDWALSNMLIDNDTIRMCDWDNLGIYPMAEVINKLHEDLTSSFGVLFLKLIK